MSGGVWKRGGETISKLQPGLVKRNKGLEVAEPDVFEAEVGQCEEPGKGRLWESGQEVLALSGDPSKGLGQGCAMIRDIFTE